MSTALKVLLDKRENEKRELGENALHNIEVLILLYLHKIKEADVNQSLSTYLSIH